MAVLHRLCFGISLLAFALGATAQPVPKGTVEVKPLARPASQAAGANLKLASGQFFTYALPQGWRVGEDGQFALTLIAPDSKALTVMVGNAGVPINFPPAQFVHDKLMSIKPQGLQLSAPRQAKPIAGFAQAWEFQVSYNVNGVPCRGLATLHIAPAYDSAVMAMTAALSEAAQWQGYASWLPLVAAQVAAKNGAAFGMRGVMQQNLQNSTAYAQAAKEYRDWSQKNWQAVTDQRNNSTDRNNAQFRETLGNVQSYVNPHDTRAAVELPNTWKYFWVNEQGTIVGTNDPSINPNSGSTNDWRKMPKRSP
ncbi:MAG: hypothetical protein ABI645_04760 [Pseudomonadota bacterium]